jgi:hypothetical protein
MQQIIHDLKSGQILLEEISAWRGVFGVEEKERRSSPNLHQGVSIPDTSGVSLPHAQYNFI